MPDQNQTATVIQCHKCQKRLKYSGTKPYVSCPGCGESIPVPDNIQEGDVQEAIGSPPVQTSVVQSAPAQATITQAAPVQTAIDEPNWQVARGQERFGPFTREQVLQGIAGGRIASADFLWNPSLTDWQPASALFPGQVLPPELPPSPIGSVAMTSTKFSRLCNRTVIAGIVSSILSVAFYHFLFMGAEYDKDGFRLQGSSASAMITLIGMTGVQIAVMIRQSKYNQTEYRSVMKCLGIAQILIGLSALPLLLCGVCAMFLLPPK